MTGSMDNPAEAQPSADAFEGLVILNTEEFRSRKGQFSHYKELLHSLGSIRYCKAEPYRDCLLGTMRVPPKNEEDAPLVTFAFYLTERALLLIEDTGRLKPWIEKHAELQESSSPAQLLFGLLESLIKDDIFYLSHLEKGLEELESEITEKPPQDFFLALTSYRRKLSEYHAYYGQLTALGERLYASARGSQDPSAESWENYTRRTERLQNHVRLLRENAAQLRELYQAQQDARQNRVMGILTVVTTLFLPLTLLTGWYGMNFLHMPELRWEYGYPAVITVAVVIVVLEIVYFKRKKFF